MSLLKPDAVSVRADGELVVVNIGNVELKIGYEDSLKLAQWIRYHGKIAKKNAGDMSRHWSVVGNLTAVENNSNPFSKV
jgi:hypothetical protein